MSEPTTRLKPSDETKPWWESHQGQWVDYEDARAEIERLQAKMNALRRAIEDVIVADERNVDVATNLPDDLVDSLRKLLNPETIVKADPCFCECHGSPQPCRKVTNCLQCNL